MPIAVGTILAIFVALFAHVVGFDRGKIFDSTVLIIIGSYYVLFAVMAGGSGLVTETVFFALFAVLAVVGFKTSLWLVVAGLALHGLFDFVRLGLLPGKRSSALSGPDFAEATISSRPRAWPFSY